MKSTGLTSRETKLIEDITATFGLVVTFEQIAGLLDEKTRADVRTVVSRLMQKGWLFPIKRGLYAVCDISTRGSFPLSEFVVPNLLVEASYVSYESALQYHGMYDQLLTTMRSVALMRHGVRTVGAMTYRFVFTQPKYYYGWETIGIDGQQVKMAAPEKALIDLLQYHRSVFAVDLVIEMLRDYRHRLDMMHLLSNALRSTLAVQRILGFGLEIVGAEGETNRLYEVVRRQTSHSRMSEQSQLYSARWRLYYDDYFAKQLHGEGGLRQ